MERIRDFHNYALPVYKSILHSHLYMLAHLWRCLHWDEGIENGIKVTNASHSPLSERILAIKARGDVH